MGKIYGGQKKQTATKSYLIFFCCWFLLGQNFPIYIYCKSLKKFKVNKPVDSQPIRIKSPNRISVSKHQVIGAKPSMVYFYPKDQRAGTRTQWFRVKV